MGSTDSKPLPVLAIDNMPVVTHQEQPYLSTNENELGAQYPSNTEDSIDATKPNPTESHKTASSHDVCSSRSELCHNLTKKKEIVPNLRMFQMVDQLARNTPGELSSSSDRLLTYLLSSCTTTLHIIRIFYMWIIYNIRCVEAKQENITLYEFKPAVVLEKKETSPIGMSLLFYYFCSQVRIPCSLVHGVLKRDNQNNCSLRVPKNTPNHAWVLILVQDQWRFIDCACGSHVSSDTQDASLTREFYFLPDPELLINSHYPMGMTNEINVPGLRDTVKAAECLQMLEKPFSFGQFCRQAKVSITALDISLQLLTHLSATVRIDKAEQLSFRSPYLEDIGGILTDRTSGKEFPYCLLCMRVSSSEYRIIVKPEYAGNYKLEVFGKIRGCPGCNSLRKLVDYVIIAQEVEEKFAPFPNHFGIWGANSKALEFGFSRRIFKFDALLCRTGDLYIKLPLANHIRVKSIISQGTTTDKVESVHQQYSVGSPASTSTMCMQSDGVVHIKARFDSPGFFSLSLLAQNPPPSGLLSLATNPSFTNVADFLVNCRRRSPYDSTLPKSFPSSQQYQCLLIEPLHRDLVVNHTYTIKVASPCMQVLKIDGEKMMRETKRHALGGTLSSIDGNGDSEGELSEDVNDNITVCPIREGQEMTVWSLRYTPSSVGSTVYVYGGYGKKGKISQDSALNALFAFRVAEDVDFDHREDSFFI